MRNNTLYSVFTIELPSDILKTYILVLLVSEKDNVLHSFLDVLESLKDLEDGTKKCKKTLLTSKMVSQHKILNGFPIIYCY